jgi:hypothetical protein
MSTSMREEIKVGFVAAPPGVVHPFHTSGDRPARWLTLHAPDGGFAAFMRGVRDGVSVELDISPVPTDRGLPASEAIGSRRRGPLLSRDAAGSTSGIERVRLPTSTSLAGQTADLEHPLAVAAEEAHQAAP